jgi:alanyl aminopeptidase
VRPRGYTVHLTLDPREERFSGEVTIALTIDAATSYVVLHGRNLAVASAEVSVGTQTMRAKVTTRMAHGAKEDPEELVLGFDRPLPAGKAELAIKYATLFNTQLRGLYRVKDGGAWYAFTQFESVDARRAFPCFDEPEFKTPFDLWLTVPSTMTAVANTPQIAATKDPSGKTTTLRFATSAPLPTYLIAIAVGTLEIREGQKSPVPIRLVTTPGKSKLGELALDASAAFLKLQGEYFGRPYPYEKLDIVAVPDFAAGAMENAGLVTFREELLLLDPAHASIGARRRMAGVVAHELAHQWFGNLVTMKWWDDVWLNEGFATWMQAKSCDAWQPSFGARIDLLGSKGSVMGADALPSARPVRWPVTDSDSILEAGGWTSYIKGSSVLTMLERWLGEETFRTGIRDYLKAHEHGNVTSDDLLAALGKASSMDVKGVASTFLDQSGVPLVRAELICEKGKKTRLHLRQSQFRSLRREAAKTAPPPRAWKIPVCTRFESKGGAKTRCTLLDGAEGELVLDESCPAWVHPNADEAGYFRFALPKTELDALAKARTSLEARERVGLVTDVWALVTAGEVGVDTWLSMLTAFKGESTRAVIEPLIGTLESASAAVIDDASRPKFRAYVSSLLLPLGKSLGFDPKPGEDEDRKLLRRAVLGALGELADDPWTLAEAEKRAVAFLADPKSVDADTAMVAVRLASYRAKEKRLLELQAAIERATTPEERIASVTALGAMGDANLLRRALDLFLEGKIKIQDFRYLQIGATRRPEGRKLFHAWIEEHFDALKKRLPGTGGLLWSAADTCDEKSRESAAKFFGERIHAIEGAARALEEALEVADACIALRAHEEARATKWLAGFPG